MKFRILRAAMLAALLSLVVVLPAVAQWQVCSDCVPFGRGAGTGFNSNAGVLGTDQVTRVNPASADGGNVFAGSNVGNTTLSPGGGASSLASFNTGLGKDSLYSLTTGFNNTTLGYNNLGAATTASNSTAVGANALGSTTSGANNTAIGSSAMYVNTTGTHNTAVGLQSFYSNQSGSHNTSIGRDSGFSNTTGNWNTNLGVDACPGTSTGSGNTCVGGEAGYTNNLAFQNVTGSNNTWIGYQSGPDSATQYSNSIGIGYRAFTTASFQAMIGGSDITETILRGDVKPPRVLLSGTAGVGFLEMPTQTIAAAAGAAGTLRVYTDASERFAIKNANGFAAGVSLASLTASRNFTLPDADGTIALTAGATIPTVATGDILYGSAANTLSALADVATGNALISGGVGVAPAWGKIASSHLNITTTSCTNQFVNAISSGAVGTCATVGVSQLGGAGTGVLTALAVNVGTAGSPVVNGGALGSPSSAGTMPAFTLGGAISGGGNQINNVIIGTTTPLAITGTVITGNSFVPNLSTVPSNGLYLPAANTVGLSTNSTARLFVDSGGNVGIGLSSPTTYNYGSFVLAVGGTTVPSIGAVGLVGAQTSDATIGDLQFNNDSIGGADRLVGFIRMSRSGANNSGKFTFYTRNAGVSVAGMTIDPDGTVGINNAAASTSSTTGAGKVTGGLGVSGALWAGTYLNTTTNTVSALPACGAGIKGARTFVSDNATALGFAAVITTGGAIQTPVYCDGTVWRQGSNDNFPTTFRKRKYA